MLEGKVSPFSGVEKWSKCYKSLSPSEIVCT